MSEWMKSPSQKCTMGAFAICLKLKRINDLADTHPVAYDKCVTILKGALTKGIIRFELNSIGGYIVYANGKKTRHLAEQIWKCDDRLQTILNKIK